jgi:hypothetical protein
LVEGDHPVLLSTNRDSGYIIEAAGSGDRLLKCGPPRIWVDFGPRGVSCATFSNEAPTLCIPNDNFDRLSRTIDTGD